MRTIIARAVAAAAVSALAVLAAADWPAAVAGHVPPAPGEHPRLFFRIGDVPALRRRAATPDGAAIIARCRKLLGGATAVRSGADFTLWDGAAYGFLWQVTGDAAYARLARGSVERALEPGVTDRDNRYAIDPPHEPMRYGPSLSAIAMAYDLCYDAWDPAFRRRIAETLVTHRARCTKRGGEVSLERIATDADNPNPVSNHFGLQVGGAGLTLLAVQGDEGTDPARIAAWMQANDRQVRKVLREDFGETGYFAEHGGPGTIAMTWTMTPYILAERVCAGRDWVSPRPDATSAEWMALHYVHQAIAIGGKPIYMNAHPQGSGYGDERLVQSGGHHATYFCQGFGAITPQRKAAMLWSYRTFVEPHEHAQYGDQLEAGEESYDVFTYPHRALFAFLAWPIGVEPENPARTIPLATLDRRYGHCVFRNRFQDGDDILVGVLFGARTHDKGVRRLQVWGLGQRMAFCSPPAAIQGSPKVGQVKLDDARTAADGSGVVSAGGCSIGVDFGRSSGADALVVVAGTGADAKLSGGGTKAEAHAMALGGTPVAILVLGGALPEPKVDGARIAVGAQTVSLENGRVVFGTMAGPPTIPQ